MSSQCAQFQVTSVASQPSAAVRTRADFDLVPVGRRRLPEHFGEPAPRAQFVDASQWWACNALSATRTELRATAEPDRSPDPYGASLQRMTTRTLDWVLIVSW